MLLVKSCRQCDYPFDTIDCTGMAAIRTATGKQTLLRTKASRLFSSRKHLDDEFGGFFKGDLFLIVLLQDVLRPLVIGSDGCCLPASIVTAGITLIQLEAVCVIPTMLREVRWHSCTIVCLVHCSEGHTAETG